jgi:hypothetical protein
MSTLAQLHGELRGFGIGRQLGDARVGPHGVLVASPFVEREARLGLPCTPMSRSSSHPTRCR